MENEQMEKLVAWLSNDASCGRCRNGKVTNPSKESQVFCAIWNSHCYIQSCCNEFVPAHPMEMTP